MDTPSAIKLRMQEAFYWALKRCDQIYANKVSPLIVLMAARLNKKLNIEDARQLSKFAQNDYAAQIKAGITLLYGAEHRLSVVVDAEKCFRRAVELKPNSVEAHSYVAFSLANQGRWTESMVAAERAVAIDPTYELAQNRHALAIEELNSDVNNPDVLSVKHRIYSRFPESIAALANLEQAVAENVLNQMPNNTITLTNNTRIVTVGSCFAANLAHALTSAGITATNLTVGEIVNSTFANLEFFRWAFRESLVISEEMSRVNRDTVRIKLEDADIVIYTLGVAPCFFETLSGRFIIPQKKDAVRGVMSGKYIFRNTTVEENVNNLKAIVTLIRRSNPKCEFVFSLSPVPLTATMENRSSIEADCLSKLNRLSPAPKGACTGRLSRLFGGSVPTSPTCTARKMALPIMFLSAL